MKNHEKSDFNRKSLTSIPFGGPICMNVDLGLQVTATAAAASRELWPSCGIPSPWSPGTKYPVWGIPHFD